MTEVVKCPFCAERIQKDAVVCRYCNRQVSIPDKDAFERLKELAPHTVLVGPASDAPTPIPAPPSQAQTEVVPPANENVFANYPDALVEHTETFEEAELPSEGASLSARSSTTPLQEITDDDDADEEPYRVRPLHIVRDVVFNFTVCMFAFFFVQTWFTIGVASTVAFAISGGWGRQHPADRGKRVKVGAICLFLLDCVVYIWDSYTAEHSAVTVGVVIGEITGSAIGITLRCFIGLVLSLVFVKPNYKTASIEKIN